MIRKVPIFPCSGGNNMSNGTEWNERGSKDTTRLKMAIQPKKSQFSLLHIKVPQNVNLRGMLNVTLLVMTRRNFQ